MIDLKSTEMLVEVCWSGNEGTDTPSHFAVNITPEKLNEIAKCREIMKENKFISTIKINVDCVGYALNEDSDVADDYKESDWRFDVSQLIVYNDSCYLYCQGKYDASDQIECEVNI